jgi:type IV pilus assembly protein PilW
MKKQQRGLSLIELLVALTIGSVLIAGSVYVYSQSRKTHTTTDAIARLQENGRYVFSVIEPDIQLAGYYGFSNIPSDFKYISGGVITGAKPSTKLVPTESDVMGLDDKDSCGANFTFNVMAPVESTNGADTQDWPLKCDAEAGGYVKGTDMLTIRRSSLPPSAGNGTEVANTVQMLVSRLSPSNQYIFADGKLPPEPALKEDLVQVRDFIVRTYYIAKDSTNPDAENLPALRVKSLVNGPAFDDEEVMRGVEDIQFQLGIDTGSYDGNADIDAGLDENKDGIPDVTRGIATYYVDPNDVDNPDRVPAGAQIVSVRVWIVLRAEQAEQGFVDSEAREYADKKVAAHNDGFRRVLMSRTIQLRNTRQF